MTKSALADGTFQALQEFRDILSNEKAALVGGCLAHTAEYAAKNGQDLFFLGVLCHLGGELVSL